MDVEILTDFFDLIGEYTSAGTLISHSSFLINPYVPFSSFFSASGSTTLPFSSCTPRQ